MSSGLFRGKESLNRIELSRLIQDIEFWCFGLSATLGVRGWLDGGGGGWMGVGGSWGVPPHTCMCMHEHAHTRGKHDNFMQMAAPIGGIPGNSL